MSTDSMSSEPHEHRTHEHRGPEDSVRIELIVNGTRQSADVEARFTLADVLRETLGLTGTHLGCEHGVCGACTVLVDGDPVRSCLMFGVQADGRSVTTVEGLAPGPGRLHPMQEAFADCHGLQCGFCTPGMLLSAVAFVAHHPAPTRAEVREGLSGNLCRCTGYQSIVDAVMEGARAMSPSTP